MYKLSTLELLLNSCKGLEKEFVHIGAIEVNHRWLNFADQELGKYPNDGIVKFVYLRYSGQTYYFDFSNEGKIFNIIEEAIKTLKKEKALVFHDLTQFYTMKNY